MISLCGLERMVLVGVFAAAMIPIAARTGSFGLPLYGIPLLALYGLWAWRSLHERCLDLNRAVMTLPFLVTAGLLGMSTFLVEGAARDNFWIWSYGLLLMVYANQNWKIVFGFRFVALLALALMSIELLVALAQMATRSYIGNAVMYFGEASAVAEKVGFIAGGRVFRPVGTFGLPNLLSIFIVVMSAILMPVISGAAGFSSLIRWYVVGLLLLGLFVLVYSTSRGNIIVMLALPALYFLLDSARNNCLRIPVRNSGLYFLGGFAIVVVGGGLLAFALSEPGASGIFEGLLYRLHGVEESARFRFLQYWTSMAALVEYPWFGMGFGQSSLVWEIVDLEFPGKGNFAFPPHNSYIVMALEAGILGGLVYAGAMAWLAVHRPLELLASPPVGEQLDDRCMDGLYLAFFVFAATSLIYIVPLTRSLWPIGCFLIGLAQASIPARRSAE